MILKTKQTKHGRQQRKIMGLYTQIGMKHVPQFLSSRIIASAIFMLPDDSVNFFFTINTDGSITTGGDTYSPGSGT